MAIDVRVLRPDESAVLDHVAPGVFDDPIDARWAAEFFADPRHHLAVALAGGQVVGMASGIHYVHPDKPPELWINEVGVAPAYQGQRIGTRLLDVLLEHARTLGCGEAWVLTDQDNHIAQRLYRGAGGRMADEPPVMFTFLLPPRTPTV